MEPFTIEHNIPIPERNGMPGRGRESRYPFERMQVGDSFIVPCAPDLVKKVAARAYTTAHYHKKHRGLTEFSISVRVVEGGVRVWRTK